MSDEKICCDMMRDNLDKTCPDHGRDCVDVIMMRFKDGRYGIPIHDGGSSGIVISFCPWCGTALPKGLEQGVEDVAPTSS